jgi:hypothetical protein
MLLKGAAGTAFRDTAFLDHMIDAGAAARGA